MVRSAAITASTSLAIVPPATSLLRSTRPQLLLDERPRNDLSDRRSLGHQRGTCFERRVCSALDRLLLEFRPLHRARAPSPDSPRGYRSVQRAPIFPRLPAVVTWTIILAQPPKPVLFLRTLCATIIEHSRRPQFLLESFCRCRTCRQFLDCSDQRGPRQRSCHRLPFHRFTLNTFPSWMAYSGSPFRMIFLTPLHSTSISGTSGP